MREADLLALVIDAARTGGWHVAHFRAARSVSGRWVTPVQGDGAGFPDLVLVRERVLFVELKAGGGNLRASQRVWRDVLVAAGADYHVWTDRSLDEIVATLTAPRSMR